jgi:carbon monoxide dehydrogenase subunit G
MPTTRRSRTVHAAPDAVWRVVGDPNHLPRWWPKVQRVENVDEGSFTKVFGTSKGRPVRADFKVLSADPPRERRWLQIVEDTPFERIMTEAVERAAVSPAPDGGGAVVTLETRQKLRGLSKLGSFLVKRATRKQLDEALDELERIVR